MSKKKEISRRTFLTEVAAGGAACAIVPRHVLGRGFSPPSDTLNVGLNPRPRTCRGTMAHAAPPAASSVRKVRREISFFLLMSMSPSVHYRALIGPLRRQVLGFVRIKRKAGAGWRRRRRARGRCRRGRGCLLRRGGRAGWCRGARGAGEKTWAGDFSGRGPSPNGLRKLGR